MLGDFGGCKRRGSFVGRSRIVEIVEIYFEEVG